jgi:tetratricopeptide (TPR) repeat protein
MAKITPTVANMVPKYEAEVAANPTSPVSQIGLAWALYGQKRYADAVLAFEKALGLIGAHGAPGPELETATLDAHYGMALAQKIVGSKSQAVRHFEHALTVAEKVENRDRRQMMTKLIKAQIAETDQGEWGGFTRPA